MPQLFFPLWAALWCSLALALLGLSGCATQALTSPHVSLPLSVSDQPDAQAPSVALHHSPAAREQARQRVKALMQSTRTADAVVEIALLSDMSSSNKGAMRWCSRPCPIWRWRA
jgi:hypothetical protein